MRDSRRILPALVKWDLLVNPQQGLNCSHTHLLPPTSTRSLLRASQSHLEVLGGAGHVRWVTSPWCSGGWGLIQTYCIKFVSYGLEYVEITLMSL